MSAVLEFDCSTIRIHEPSKTVFMRGIDGSHSTFNYDIDCTADMDVYKLKFFFNTKTLKMLIVNRSVHSMNVKTCAHMKFWLTNDLPEPCTRYLYGQDQIMTLIAEEFKEKYAAVILDDAINS